MSDLAQSVLAQYEKNKAASGNSGKFSSQEERMKKYFTTIIPKGKREEERRIRILPTKDGSTPFVEVKFHEINVDGKWLKLYDPAQEGKPSPLNDVHDALASSGEEGDSELAKSYYSRKFFIVKLIDRDNEEDGPKFWRFKNKVKGDGIFDKIIPIIRKKGDITDVTGEEGCDLSLTLALTKANNGKEYSIVSAIIPDDKSPLHSDPEKIKEWVDDDLTWKDVYSIRSNEYLEMVANGEVPRWDNDQKKYVSTSTTTDEATVDGGTKPETSDEKKEPKIKDPQAEEETADDLPF